MKIPHGSLKYMIGRSVWIYWLKPSYNEAGIPTKWIVQEYVKGWYDFTNANLMEIYSNYWEAGARCLKRGFV